MSICLRTLACSLPGWTANLALTGSPALPIGPGAHSGSRGLPQPRRPEENETQARPRSELEIRVSTGLVRGITIHPDNEMPGSQK